MMLSFEFFCKRTLLVLFLVSQLFFSGSVLGSAGDNTDASTGQKKKCSCDCFSSAKGSKKIKTQEKQTDTANNDRLQAVTPPVIFMDHLNAENQLVPLQEMAKAESSEAKASVPCPPIASKSRRQKSKAEDRMAQLQPNTHAQARQEDASDNSIEHYNGPAPAIPPMEHEAADELRPSRIGDAPMQEAREEDQTGQDSDRRFDLPVLPSYNPPQAVPHDPLKGVKPSVLRAHNASSHKYLDCSHSSKNSNQPDSQPAVGSPKASPSDIHGQNTTFAVQKANSGHTSRGMPTQSSSRSFKLIIASPHSHAQPSPLNGSHHLVRQVSSVTESTAVASSTLIAAKPDHGSLMHMQQQQSRDRQLLPRTTRSKGSARDDTDGLGTKVVDASNGSSAASTAVAFQDSNSSNGHGMDCQMAHGCNATHAVGAQASSHLLRHNTPSSLSQL